MARKPNRAGSVVRSEVRFALVAPEPRQRGRRGCGAELGAAELPAELLAAEALARSQPGRRP